MEYCFWCHGAIKRDVEVDPRGKLKSVKRCLMCARSTNQQHELEVTMVHHMIDFEVSLLRGRHPQQSLDLFLPLEACEEEEVIGEDGAITDNRFMLF